MTGRADLAGFIDALHRRWDEVSAQPDLHTRQLRVADVDVELAVGGDRLAQLLLPAFDSHLPAGGPPTCVIGAWDAQATGVGLPPLLPPDEGPVRRWTAERDGTTVIEVLLGDPGTVRAMDADAHRYLLGFRDLDAVQPWDFGAPFRRQLFWALGPEVVFVHAAGVSTDDGVALLMGPSGSGKSTTALTCARAGMGFLGDDYCVVRPSEDGPAVVHMLHATARVFQEELDTVAGDGWTAAPGPLVEDEKALVPAPAERIVHQGPLRVVLVPEQSDEKEPRLVPMSTAEARRAVAPSALWQLHRAPAAELAGLRRVLASVPTYRLLLNRDLRTNPEAVRNAIAASAEPRPLRR